MVQILIQIILNVALMFNFESCQPFCALSSRGVACQPVFTISLHGMRTQVSGIGVYGVCGWMRLQGVEDAGMHRAAIR